MIFGNLGNLGDMMKQAQKLQGDLKQIKEELKTSVYDAESNGVRAVVNGEMEIKELKLNPALDQKKLEESVKQAMNSALKKAKEDAAERLKAATGGLSLPGM